MGETTTPTTYGLQDGFDYEGFKFSAEFPIPTVYVNAYGMPHFRGPDGHLWFAPDEPDDQIGWGYPQNVAEFDQRDGNPIDDEYTEIMASLCRLIDAAGIADALYDRWCGKQRAAATRPACASTN